MSRSSRLVVAALVTAFFVVSFVPETVLWVASAVRTGWTNAVSGIGQPVPRPVLVGLLMLFFLLVSFGVIFGVVRLFTTVGTSTGERVAGWYDRATPDSPQTKALVFMVGFVVVFIVGIAVFAPTLAASLASDTGANDFVDDLEDGNYGNQLDQLFATDTVRPTNGTVALGGDNDTDGDGLPDAWERAGRTPDGVALPSASPNRTDLYVQISYAGDAQPLSDQERQRLEAIWAGMPVDNPDGSTGIDLHVVETRLANSVQDSPEQLSQLSSNRYLGERACVYRHVVLGELDTTDRIGLAETPGYAAVYDGSRFQGHEGEVPFRSAMVTHGLLHTVVGELDGGVHVAGTWLDQPDSGNGRLSAATAARLEDGFRTTVDHWERCRQNSSR